MSGMAMPSWAAAALLASLAALTPSAIILALLNRPCGARRYPWWLRGVVLGFGPGLSILFCGVAVVEEVSARDMPVFLILLAGFGGIGFPLSWELMRFGYTIMPQGIDAVSPWRGRWFIAWEDVDAVSYAAGWFRIVSSKAGGFAIPLLASDGNELLEEAEKHLDHERLARAITGYSAVGRRFPYTGQPPRSLRR